MRGYEVVYVVFSIGGFMRNIFAKNRLFIALSVGLLFSTSAINPVAAQSISDDELLLLAIANSLNQGGESSAIVAAPADPDKQPKPKKIAGHGDDDNKAVAVADATADAAKKAALVCGEKGVANIKYDEPVCTYDPGFGPDYECDVTGHYTCN